MFWTLLTLHCLQGLSQMACVYLLVSSVDSVQIKQKSRSYWVILWIPYTILSLVAAYLFGIQAELSTQIIFLAISRTMDILFLLFVFPKEAYKHILCFCFLCEILINSFTQSAIFTIKLFMPQLNMDLNTYEFRAFQALLDMLIGFVILWLVWRISHKRMFKSFDRRSLALPGRVYSILIATLLFAVVLENYILYENSSDPLITDVVRGMAVVILNLMFIVIVYLFVIHNSHSYYRNLTDMLSQQVEMQIHHYQNLKEREEVMFAFRHDYKNMMLCLRALVEVGDTEQALQYIDQMDLRTTPQRLLIDSGNYIADALIAEKMQSAAATNTNITLEGFIPSSRIENLDVCIILGNALNNAIEACEKMGGEKTISIVSSIQNNCWLLRVQNPVAHAVLIKNNRIATTKADADFHGFGLYNIQTAVKRNDGQISLNCDGKLFTLAITLRLNQELCG